jgi:hypothetical protein
MASRHDRGVRPGSSAGPRARVAGVPCPLRTVDRRRARRKWQGTRGGGRRLCTESRCPFKETRVELRSNHTPEPSVNQARPAPNRWRERPAASSRTAGLAPLRDRSLPSAAGSFGQPVSAQDPDMGRQVPDPPLGGRPTGTVKGVSSCTRCDAQHLPPPAPPFLHRIRG